MSAGRPGWRPVAALQALTLLLAAGAWGVLKSQAPPPTQLGAGELERAAEVLEARLSAAERRRVSPLDPKAMNALSSFVGLQVDAAQLNLAGLKWGELIDDGAAQVLPLELEVIGDPLNLPILIDGLYRQSHPAVLTALALVHQRDGAARAILRLRLIGPLPSPAWTELDGQTPGDRALAAAAKERDAEAFEAVWAGVEDRSHANRRTVMRALPALVRGLPEARKGWLGLAMEDEVLVPLAGERPR